jgi:putative SbcD/Mre11-related phosphoesterase
MEIVPGERAVFLEDGKTLVVSDTHIGFQIELARSGIRIPPQEEDFADKISSLYEKTGAKKLVLLGDVKHAFLGPTYDEEDKVVSFLNILLDRKLKVEIVPGNHDGDLGNVLPRKIKLHKPAGAIIGETGLFHGHSWPDEKILSCKNIILSHIHPSVAFVDTLGAFHKEPCFLAARILPAQASFNFPGARVNKSARVLVMPAWNPLLGGGIVQDLKFDSGFWKCLDLAGARVLLVDGTFIGTVGALRKQ